MYGYLHPLVRSSRLERNMSDLDRSSTQATYQVQLYDAYPQQTDANVPNAHTYNGLGNTRPWLGYSLVTLYMNRRQASLFCSIRGHVLHLSLFCRFWVSHISPFCVSHHVSTLVAHTSPSHPQRFQHHFSLSPLPKRGLQHYHLAGAIPLHLCAQARNMLPRAKSCSLLDTQRSRYIDIAVISRFCKDIQTNLEAVCLFGCVITA